MQAASGKNSPSTPSGPVPKSLSGSQPALLYGLNDKPPLGSAMVAGLQHLAAIFGGIVTAPLIIARGMDLPVDHTNYLVISALLVSGLATLLQITRIGIVGSGLLSIQGTSFTFIGAMLYAFFSLPEQFTAEQRLGTLFGSAAIASLLMLPVCYNIQRLRHVFTSTVTGATVILLGTSLVWSTLLNLGSEVSAQETMGARLAASGLALFVFCTALVLSLSRHYWLRMTSIVCGLGAGFVTAMLMGQVDFSLLAELEKTFLPEPFRFGFSVDWRVVVILLPVFLVTATESIGDLTATSALSRLPVAGPEYWQRVRGGLLADVINSFLASILATFPNTTFSQNNGVIRLTGIASRHVGYVVAVLLILLGLFPVVGGIFQLLPGVVLYGATLLMFCMVGMAGVNILSHSGAGRRDWMIAALAIAGGWLISIIAGEVPFLHPQLQMLLQFPVSTGAVLAIVMELTVPDENADASGGRYRHAGKSRHPHDSAHNPETSAAP